MQSYHMSYDYRMVESKGIQNIRGKRGVCVQLQVTEILTHYGLNITRNTYNRKIQQSGLWVGTWISSLKSTLFCVLCGFQSRVLRGYKWYQQQWVHILYYLFPKREKELISLNYQMKFELYQMSRVNVTCGLLWSGFSHHCGRRHTFIRQGWDSSQFTRQLEIKICPAQFSRLLTQWEAEII